MREKYQTGGWGGGWGGNGCCSDSGSGGGSKSGAGERAIGRENHAENVNEGGRAYVFCSHFPAASEGLGTSLAVKHVTWHSESSRYLEKTSFLGNK